MKQHILFAAAAAALVTLAGCNSEPETIVGDGPADVQAAELAKAAPVELPPSIVASRSYRCKDNSLVFVDFMSNDTAVFRTKKDGEPVSLAAATPGGPYTAEGHSVSTNAAQVEITAPGKGSQSCKA